MLTLLQLAFCFGLVNGCFGAALQYPLDPTQYDTRPRPSNSFPVVPLVESTGSKYDPLDNDIDTAHLRKLLGAEFDGRFVMVHRSAADMARSNNGTLDLPFVLTKKHRIVPLKGQRPSRELRRLFRHTALPYGVSARMHMRRKLKRRMMQYLWAYTYCPVLYRWRDLGKRFWPRFIREGQCFNGRSCSIPVGMSCQPGKSKQVPILRWHCKGWGGGDAQYCSWIKIYYPVLTQCTCGCPSTNHRGSRS